MSITEINEQEYREEKKFVAFIDVLGFSELVNNTKIDEINLYLRNAYFEAISIDKQLKVFMISDSIIIVSNNTFEEFKKLLQAIQKIQNVLLKNKILIRGGISCGEVHVDHPNNIIIGKGFIAAFDLEKEAKYPRVIIDPLIIKKFSDNKKDFLSKINSNSQEIIKHQNMLINDTFDRIVEDSIFVSYANSYLSKDLSILNEQVNKIIELFNEKMYGKQKHYSTYIWLRNHFTDVAFEVFHTIAGSEISDRHILESEINKLIVFLDKI